MILTFLSIDDADGSASRYNAKHIASSREAMRRCVINQRPTSIASDDAIRDSTFEIEILCIWNEEYIFVKNQNKFNYEQGKRNLSHRHQHIPTANDYQ